ncbi:TPA: hypothetical protein VDA67_002311 [Burkholderia vietnamiensis]|nr:hypothetical protein [Burkholderia vietnamiensis]HEP6283964.1 hypothetical protein [Burkholderia vietnamiensis]HEP6309430.1 hypothetical protein [Burkholderia vietnamiensis]
MSTDDLGEGNRSPYFPNLKTAEDVRKYIEDGGAAWVESRIEDSFAERLHGMKEKIARLESLRSVDPFLSNVLVESILVDCRALFLERKKKDPAEDKNSTLQNVYRARGEDEKAKKIDDVFERKILNKSLKTIIKGWVDKRIVHMDFLKKPEEDELFSIASTFIFSEDDSGMLPVLRAIVDEYEAFTGTHGPNMRAAIDRVFELLTGNPHDKAP